MVKIVLRESAALVRRLERAGLDVKQSGDGWVIGSVAIESLATLAEQRGVVRMDLP